MDTAAKATKEETPQDVVGTLRDQMDRLSQGGRPQGEVLPSGFAALDRLLPRGGFVPGTLIEWLSERPASGAGSLALLTAREAAACRGGYVVVLDRDGWFYPPAAAAWGLDLKRLLVIRAANARDEMWAIDQALRCEAVAAVWAPTTHLESQLDSRCLRRWQLAAEQGGTLGLLLRSARARRQPCWSDAQLAVRAVGGREACESWELRVELLRVRGAAAGGAARVRIVNQQVMDRRAGTSRRGKKGTARS